MPQTRHSFDHPGALLHQPRDYHHTDDQKKQQRENEEWKHVNLRGGGRSKSASPKKQTLVNNIDGMKQSPPDLYQRSARICACSKTWALTRWGRSECTQKRVASSSLTAKPQNVRPSATEITAYRGLLEDSAPLPSLAPQTVHPKELTSKCRCLQGYSLFRVPSTNGWDNLTISQPFKKLLYVRKIWELILGFLIFK